MIAAAPMPVLIAVVLTRFHSIRSARRDSVSPGSRASAGKNKKFFCLRVAPVLRLLSLPLTLSLSLSGADFPLSLTGALFQSFGLLLVIFCLVCHFFCCFLGSALFSVFGSAAVFSFSIETGFKLKLSLVIFLMVSCRLLYRCCSSCSSFCCYCGCLFFNFWCFDLRLLRSIGIGVN